MWLDDPGSYTSWDFGHWWVQSCWAGFGWKARRIPTPGPPGWGLGDGLISHPWKKYHYWNQTHFLDSTGGEVTVWRPYVQRNAKRQGKVNDSVWVYQSLKTTANFVYCTDLWKFCSIVHRVPENVRHNSYVVNKSFLKTKLVFSTSRW